MGYKTKKCRLVDRIRVYIDSSNDSFVLVNNIKGPQIPAILVIIITKKIRRYRFTVLRTCYVKSADLV